MLQRLTSEEKRPSGGDGAVSSRRNFRDSRVGLRLLVFSLGFVLGFTLALWVGFSPARTNLVLGLGTDICLFVYTVAIRLLAIAGYWVELIWAFFYNIYWLISDLVLFSARCAGRLVGLYEFTGQETYWGTGFCKPVGGPYGSYFGGRYTARVHPVGFFFLTVSTVLAIFVSIWKNI